MSRSFSRNLRVFSSVAIRLTALAWYHAAADASSEMTMSESWATSSSMSIRARTMSPWPLDEALGELEPASPCTPVDACHMAIDTCALDT
jgi:hypothetical protein